MSIDWSDLRFVLAVARNGTVRAAAQELRINHATISRHLRLLQERLGVHVFERRGRGLVLTDAGAELLDVARSIEERVVDVERRISGRDLRLHGTVRVALTESIAQLLAPELEGFSAEYPGVTLDLATGMAFKNLAQMEADVAVRVVAKPPELLVGRHIGDFYMTAFAAKSLASCLDGVTLAGLPWIGWAERFSHFPMERWLRQHVPRAQIRFSVDSEPMMHALIRAGVGVGFLPYASGKADAALQDLPPSTGAPTFMNSLWVLTHEDMRRTPRVRVVARWFSETLTRLLSSVPRLER